MHNKSLLYGIVGFLLGGFVASFAATYLQDEQTQHSEMSMTQMTRELENKSGDEFDKAFISLMIEHHDGAIEMAKLAERQAKHEEVKTLSRNIVAAQEKEISDMTRWQTQWGYTDSAEHPSH